MMKRSTKQLLSLLLAIVMVFGLMAPAMAARPMMGEVAETPVGEASGAKLSGSSRPAVSAPVKAELLADGDTKTLNASTMTAFAAGGKADGDTEVVDGFFTVHYGAKDKVDANSKTFDDGFAGTQRLNFGAISDFTKGSDYIEFTITEPTLVKLWWVHNKGARHTAIIKEADTAFADPVWDSEGGADNQLRMDSAYLSDAGKYFIAFPTNETNPGGNYIFKVEAIALATEPTETKGTLGTPSITVAESKDKDGVAVAGKYDVTVSGVAIGKTEDATTYNTVQNAEKVVVSAYKDGATEACLTSTITKWTAADGTNTVTLDVGSQGTGSYTFKAVATQGDSTTESALSSAVSYTLPLAKPALTATAGNAKVTLSWAAVKEATSYEVYQGDTKLTGEPTLTSGVYYLEVTGLTNGTAYSFTVKAIRETPAADATSDAATATPVAPTEGGEVTVNKYSLDATKVLTDEPNNTKVSAADLTAATTLSVDGGAATEGARYFGITTGTYEDKGATQEGGVLKRSAPTKGLELTKQASASIDFTVKGEAKVTVNLASTNATNVSMFALVNDAGAVQMPTLKHAYTTSGNKTSSIADGSTVIESITPAAGVVVVCGYTATADDSTIVEYTLPAGTYHMQSYEQFAGRAVWVLGANVSDTYMDAGELEENIVDWTVAAICGTPKYTTSVDATKGTITVNVVGPKVGAEESGSSIDIYADKLSIVMYNADGTEMASVEDNAEGNTHKGVFTPVATGKYTFKVRVSRTGETDLLSAASDEVDFILPLATPAISSAASNGKEEGKETASVTLMWAKVPEATNYNVRYKEHGAADWGTTTKIDAPSTSNVSYVVTGLTVGKAYDFQAQAIRNTEESAWSAVFEGDEITATKQTPWTEVVFGTSTTDASNNVVSEKTTVNYTGIGEETVAIKDGTYTMTYNGKTTTIEGLTGDLNTDPNGRVLLTSRDGAGKIKENEGGDGQLFYYTPIPAGMNYTLTADVEVLRWATRDTQNGVGLAAMDRVAAKSWTGTVTGNSGTYWNNTYMAGAARLSFSFDKKAGNLIYSQMDMGYDAATKYSYYMGLLSVAKNGIPMTANGPWDESAGPGTYYERRFPLDTRIPSDGITAKSGSSTNRFNIIGNYTKQPAGFSLLDENSAFMTKYELTKFKVQLQKNNTGYISTVWDEKGNKLGENIEYFVKGAMDLSGDKPYHDDDQSGRKDIASLQQCLDSDYEYVGLFTSRDLDAVFSNVKLTTIPAENDAPAVLPPIAKVTPSMSISSGTSSNTEDFKFSIATNVDGTAVITMNGKALDPVAVTGDYRCDVPVKLEIGNNSFTVTFTPDPDQELPAFTELANTTPITRSTSVTFEGYYSNMTNLYVSPAGRSNYYGTQARPLDIYTAVKVVRPGQHIILMEGEYKLDQTVRINRGMDGCETMEVEVEDTAEVPVLDEEGNAVLDKDGNPVTEIKVTGTHTETVDGRIFMLADVDENGKPVKVVLNGQGKYGAVTHASDWWVFKDFEIVNSGSTGFQLSGSHNVVQNLKIHDNLSTGLQISRLAAGDHVPDRSNANVGELDEVEGITDWGDWPCFNTIINCDSYRNYDSGYNGADGFGAKLTCGEGNVFDGCVAYWNADDGWDLYAKTSDEEGPIGRVTLKNCITFENGYEVRKLVDTAKQIPAYEADGYTPVMNLDADGKIILAPAGNGNGFKLGGSHLPGAHSISNSYAFYNACKGFDSNNGPDIKISGCTAYNNAEENIGLDTKYKTNDYLVEKTVSFKDDDAPKGKNGEVLMKDANPTGGTSVYNYYQWDGSASKGVGTVSGNITAASFVSLVWDNTAWIGGAVRDADGSLDLGDFLKLTGAVTDAGAGDLVNDVTPVETPDAVINPPEESPSGSTGSNGGGGGIGGGGGGSIADLTNKEDNKGTTTGMPFVDVADNAWYHDTVEKAYNKGLMNGIDATHFAPDMNTTRAMVVTILYRLDGQKKVNGTTAFTDLTADWYKDAVIWAANTGVVKGMSDTVFAPDLNVTREQLATMLYRYANAAAAKADALDGFVDASNVSDWAAQGMAWCVANGIINGKGANNLDPQGQATRAEAVTMLVRFAELMKK